MLDETDDLWTNMRHKHIAEVNMKLSEKLNEFKQKNKAAQYAQAGAGLDNMRAFRQLVQAIPEYR